MCVEGALRIGAPIVNVIRPAFISCFFCNQRPPLKRSTILQDIQLFMHSATLTQVRVRLLGQGAPRQEETQGDRTSNLAVTTLTSCGS